MSKTEIAKLRMNVMSLNTRKEHRKMVLEAQKSVRENRVRKSEGDNNG